LIPSDEFDEYAEVSPRSMAAKRIGQAGISIEETDRAMRFAFSDSVGPVLRSGILTDSIPGSAYSRLWRRRSESGQVGIAGAELRVEELNRRVGIKPS
jgi:hypothetical protein